MFASQVIQGRWLGVEDLEALQRLIAEHPHWSRRRLSIALCEALNWRTVSGQLKDMSARLLLNKLAERGFIKLPPRQRGGGRQILRALSEPELFSLSAGGADLIEGPLRALQPLEVIPVEPRTTQANAFICHLAQHHYLGYGGAAGQNLRYLIGDCYGRDLACLLFGAAAWKVKARDEFIGWSAEQRQERLSLIINNSRFLILPQSQIEQTIEDIPPVYPRVTRLRTYEATCVQCGQSVRSTHPLQMSLATGAAGVQLGPRALALAADLNKAKGLSMRKTCTILRDCFELQLSPGGLSQALDRLAAKLKPQYDAIATELRQAPVLHSDETSWWVAGPGWWLWVFTASQFTFYVVAQSRGRDLLNDILGKDFGGVLVSDCLAIYDDTTAVQHKCYAHHHKAISKAKALHPHQGEGFLCEVAAMLRAAVALQEQKAELSLETFRDLRQALEHKAVQLLEAPRNEPNEEAVRNRLNKQRDHLFTFLDHDGVDATNNLAERQLRPAVIARKISCGNKTLKGARTWQILASLAATCAQRATSFIAALARAAPLQAR